MSRPRRPDKGRTPRKPFTRRPVGKLKRYRVIVRGRGRGRRGMIVPRAPCNVGEIVVGTFRDEDGRPLPPPVAGVVVERTEAEAPFAATLTLDPQQLPSGKPFDPV